MSTPTLAGLFILFILVTNLNSMAILTDSVVLSIKDSLSWVSNWRLLTYVIYCFTSFGLGIIFIVPNGSQILQNTQYAVESSSILLSFMMVRSLKLTVYGDNLAVRPRKGERVNLEGSKYILYDPRLKGIESPS